jgi:hypothetical protein
MLLSLLLRKDHQKGHGTMVHLIVDCSNARFVSVFLYHPTESPVDGTDPVTSNNQSLHQPEGPVKGLTSDQNRLVHDPNDQGPFGGPFSQRSVHIKSEPRGLHM